MHKDIHERSSAARNVGGEVKLLHEPRADRPENKGTQCKGLVRSRVCVCGVGAALRGTHPLSGNGQRRCCILDRAKARQVHRHFNAGRNGRQSRSSCNERRQQSQQW